jgi:hypothetical protein
MKASIFITSTPPFLGLTHHLRSRPFLVGTIASNFTTHSLTFPASSLVHHKFLPHFLGTAVFLSSFDSGVSCFVKFFSIRFAEVRTLDNLTFGGLREWCALQE